MELIRILLICGALIFPVTFFVSGVYELYKGKMSPFTDYFLYKKLPEDEDEKYQVNLMLKLRAVSIFCILMYLVLKYSDF